MVAHCESIEQYRAMYEQSLEDPEKFWNMIATQQLTFLQPYTDVMQGSLTEGNVAWFLNGKLNACHNAVDRHISERGRQTAILWEGDEPGTVRRITYLELLDQVCRLSNLLTSLGVGRGDVVCIYMPMIPEAAIAMLACARIGAPHSVVFAGFSSEALRDRIVDGNAKVVLTADQGTRAGRIIPLKDFVDVALAGCTSVTKCIVYQHTGATVNFVEGRDISWQDAMALQRPYCPCVSMDSEDVLFLLYTSGSTGKPKGIAHTTAGYLLWSSFTQKLVFDYQEGDVFGCVADVGWITGHSYIVYGPLLNGATTFMFESTPLYPDCSRYWDMVDRHKLSVLYTAPTAIRALMTYGCDQVDKYDLSSLKVLGTVGEPINPEAWKWYNEVVGKSKVPIVDTYWQTETGGIMISPLPGITPTKPGSATLPFFGVDLALLDPHTGVEIVGDDVEGVLVIKRPWPGMARTIYGDHVRYRNVYLDPYLGYYFTGDGATRDSDGYYWITGRVDDVINVAGHRIGSAEVESALVCHPSAAEAAVVGVPHDVKGTAVFAYVIAKMGVYETADLASLEKDLTKEVRTRIGPFAAPSGVLIVRALPKTRSGKIMRRLLRKLASQEYDLSRLGDLSTLADSGVVDDIITALKERQ